MIVRPSPNFDARPAAPDMVVLHYTDMWDVEAAIGLLTSTESKVSAHYLITAAGDLVQMVDEADRAWHAGLSFWDGTADINARAIGIELDSPGHKPDAPVFPAVQIDALIALMDGIRSRWRVPLRGVVAHSDIAPTRKIDPGERFPWARLAAAGHALHVPPATATKAAPESLLASLVAAGYGPPTDAGTHAALVRAFHRRHRPDAVDAPADATSAALAADFLAVVEEDRARMP